MDRFHVDDLPVHIEDDLRFSGYMPMSMAEKLQVIGLIEDCLREDGAGRSWAGKRPVCISHIVGSHFYKVLLRGECIPVLVEFLPEAEMVVLVEEEVISGKPVLACEDIPVLSAEQQIANVIASLQERVGEREYRGKAGDLRAIVAQLADLWEQYRVGTLLSVVDVESPF